ncbi:MAG: ABC transporter substrate-binding protein [Deltaproteobacteria bacterium]
MKPLSRIVAVIASLLALSLASCHRAPHTPAAPSRRLVVGASALRISLPVFVAARDGLFRAHGLDVEVRTYNTAQPMMDDVALGHIDAGGYVAYPIVFLASRRAARPPRVVTSLVEDRDHRLSYVLGRPGAGLHFPADARGKRIGILPTVAYRRWLIAILATVGITPEQVTIVPVEPALQNQMLRDNGIDMLFTNDPMATAILATNAGEIIDDGPPCSQRLGDPFAFGTFVMSGLFVEQSPDLARRLAEALSDAVARVRADPAGARRAMVGYIRPEEQPYVDRYPPSRYLDVPEFGPTQLAAEFAHNRQLGILTQDPSVQAWQPAR